MKQEIKDTHHGDTIIVLGNGPSLAGFDFRLLQGYVTIGTNVIRKMNFDPDYLVVMDRKCWLNNKEIVSGGHGTVFIADNVFDAPEQFIRYGRYYNDNPPFFASEFNDGLFWSNTVIMPAINLAWLMGAETIILLGLDLHDQAHCHDTENGMGEEFPRTNKILKDFERLSEFVKGRRFHILNANPDSRVKSFPFVEIKHIIERE